MRLLRGPRIAAITVSLMLLTFATVPLIGFGADHLDAPGLTPPSARGDADITDIYAFEGADPANTALVLVTNPAAGAIAPDSFGTDVLYQLKIDTDGDAVEDAALKATFGAVGANGEQVMSLRWAEGADALGETTAGTLIATGLTNRNLEIDGGGTAFAGLRSDPFFFDLGGFLGSVEGMGARMFNDGMETDFFEELNVMAIVVEVPDAMLGSAIGVWGTTAVDTASFAQVDRMGRPAINTVVNSTGLGADPSAKNVYNAAHPKDDVAAFTAAVTGVLTTLSGFDSEGPYAAGEAAALAAVLLPDILTYDTSTPAAGPLNGRALADDVIDTELNILTGGDPLGLFAGRDTIGGIPTDSIGPHTDYLAVFPYLGPPHGVAAQVFPIDDVGLVDTTMGLWHLRDGLDPGAPVTSFFFGDPGDNPVVGDWDCDGIKTPGLHRPSDGLVYLTNTNGPGIAEITYRIGNPSDIPIAGDPDGDGCDTVSLYRPSTGEVFIFNRIGAGGAGLGAADVSYVFGNPADSPFMADFNGNGIDTVALHRVSTGEVHVRNSHTSGPADLTLVYGDPGDRITAGDWTADGRDTLAVFRAPDTYFLRFSNTVGIADLEVDFGTGTLVPVSGPFGLS